MSIVHFLNGHTEFITRLLLAVLVGGVLGFEREMHGHPAGFRTHILVCLGACLMAMIDGIYPKLDERIAAQVVTGVGFLGAGTIIRANQGLTVQGLTTAASLWATAGIGIAFGFGSPAMWLGCVTGVLVLLTFDSGGGVRGQRIQTAPPPEAHRDDSRGKDRRGVSCGEADVSVDECRVQGFGVALGRNCRTPRPAIGDIESSRSPQRR